MGCWGSCRKRGDRVEVGNESRSQGGTMGSGSGRPVSEGLCLEAGRWIWRGGGCLVLVGQGCRETTAVRRGSSGRNLSSRPWRPEVRRPDVSGWLPRRPLSSVCDGCLLAVSSHGLFLVHTSVFKFPLLIMTPVLLA